MNQWLFGHAFTLRSVLTYAFVTLLSVAELVTIPFEPITLSPLEAHALNRDADTLHEAYLFVCVTRASSCFYLVATPPLSLHLPSSLRILSLQF